MKEGQITLISAEGMRSASFSFTISIQISCYNDWWVVPQKDNTLFTNWSMGWWRVQDLIDDMMDELDAHQGDLCDYLNGKSST